jgi:hypothetical protein
MFHLYRMKGEVPITRIFLVNSLAFGVLFVFLLIAVKMIPMLIAIVGCFANVFLFWKFKSKCTNLSNEIDERELIMRDLDREVDRRREAKQFNRN